MTVECEEINSTFLKGSYRRIRYNPYLLRIFEEMSVLERYIKSHKIISLILATSVSFNYWIILQKTTDTNLQYLISSLIQSLATIFAILITGIIFLSTLMREEKGKEREAKANYYSITERFKNEVKGQLCIAESGGLKQYEEEYIALLRLDYLLTKNKKSYSKLLAKDSSILLWISTLSNNLQTLDIINQLEGLRHFSSKKIVQFKEEMSAYEVKFPAKPYNILTYSIDRYTGHKFRRAFIWLLISFICLIITINFIGLSNYFCVLGFNLNLFYFLIATAISISLLSLLLFGRYVLSLTRYLILYL